MERSDRDLAELTIAVRRAYERGRWYAGVRASWPLVPLLSICLVDGCDPLRACVTAVMIAVVVSFAVHRGGALARGAQSGLRMGALPLVVALVGCRLPHACVGGTCFGWCLPGCAIAALAAGLLVLRGARAESGGRSEHVGVGLLVAAMVGAIGCAGLGLGGLVALALGTAAAGGPAWAWVRR